VLSTILLLNLWFAPAYALAAKRFQDRDKPRRRALFGLVPMQAAMLVWLWFVETPPETDPLAWVCFAVEQGTKLWFLIELGLLQGVRVLITSGRTLSTLSHSMSQSKRRRYSKIRVRVYNNCCRRRDYGSALPQFDVAALSAGVFLVSFLAILLRKEN